MADSWDLLHETMMKVNNVLGDYWMGDIEDQRLMEGSEFSSDFGNSVGDTHSSVIGDVGDSGDVVDNAGDGLHMPESECGQSVRQSDQRHLLSELMSDGQQDPGADMADMGDTDLWPPQPRARSNTWPRRQFGQMSQVIVTRDSRDTGQSSGVSRNSQSGQLFFPVLE